MADGQDSKSHGGEKALQDNVDVGLPQVDKRTHKGVLLGITPRYEFRLRGSGCVRRCFLPVGQGAFCCESFLFDEASEPINVVFDCGSLPAKSMPKRMDKALALALPEIKTIHLAYLSHLHEDHVNGLEFLQNKHHVAIKEIRYPAIDEDDQCLMKFWYTTQSQNGVAWDLCLDKVAAQRRFPGAKLVDIRPPERPIDDPDEANPNLVSLSEAAEDAGMRQSLPNAFLEWQFLTFNYRRKQMIRRLKAELKLIVAPDEVNNESLCKKWQTAQGMEAIKKAYERATDNDFNTNSMVVFSGPKFENGAMWKQTLLCGHLTPCQLFGQLKPFEPGCLYTGDYDASDNVAWTALRKHFTNQWKKIGCLQIPHHGSCSNFNKKFLKKKAIFVTSAGSHNQYGHPNACVQLVFQQAQKHLFCVTEELTTCLCSVGYAGSSTILFCENGNVYRVSQDE